MSVSIAASVSAWCHGNTVCAHWVIDAEFVDGDGIWRAWRQATIVLLNHFSWPIVWEWYAVVVKCGSFRFSKTAARNLKKKCGPLSIKRCVSTPSGDEPMKNKNGRDVSFCCFSNGNRHLWFSETIGKYKIILIIGTRLIPMPKYVHYNEF